MAPVRRRVLAFLEKQELVGYPPWPLLLVGFAAGGAIGALMVWIRLHLGLDVPALALFALGGVIVVPLGLVHLWQRRAEGR